jgi:uncharacterized protein YqgC (DUF456 family)
MRTQFSNHGRPQAQNPHKNYKCQSIPVDYSSAVTTEQIIGLILALLVMCVGVAGSILPGLPSTPVVLLAAIGHKLYFGPTGAAWWVLVVLAAFTALSLVMDYVATVYGAKKLGATWRGAVGAIVGGLIGLFFNLPGILLGPFIGAFVFEWASGREWREASKAGVGATLGLLAGALGKLACCVAMMVLFTVNVIIRSLA